MSDKNDKEPTSEKKRLNLTKEVIESLSDEDLDKAAGGTDQGFPGGWGIWPDPELSNS